MVDKKSKKDDASEDTKAAKNDEKKAASKDGAPDKEPLDMAAIKAKIDETVGKVVPEQYLATAVAGGAVLVLFFILLAIIGFARSPEDLAEAARDLAIAELTTEKDTHAQARQSIADLEAAKSGLEDSLEEAKTALAKAAAEKQSAEEAHAKISGLLKEERDNKEKLRKELQSQQSGQEEAISQAKSWKKKLERALKDQAATQESKDALQTELADLNRQLVELRKQRNVQKDMIGRAKETFENILESVAAIEDPEKKLLQMQKLRTDAAAELAGTPYMERLDKEFDRAREALEDSKARQIKEAKRDANKTYDMAIRQAKMSNTHEEAIKILEEAKELVKDTPYELYLHNEINEREDDHRMKVGREAYDKLLKKIRAAPIAYDENIAAAKEALQLTSRTKYEILVNKQLTNLKAQRFEAIGQSLYNQALAQIDKSPRDYAANIEALRELKAKAVGSRYERSIGKLLSRQEAYLEKNSR